MLGLKIDLPNDDQEVVVHSLEQLLEVLTPGEKPIFQLVIKRIRSGEILDGMGMRCIERALQHAANMTDNAQAKNKYQELTTFYTKARELFQFSMLRNITFSAGVAV